MPFFCALVLVNSTPISSSMQAVPGSTDPTSKSYILSLSSISSVTASFPTASPMDQWQRLGPPLHLRLPREWFSCVTFMTRACSWTINSWRMTPTVLQLNAKSNLWILTQINCKMVCWDNPKNLNINWVLENTKELLLILVSVIMVCNGLKKEKEIDK